MESSLLRTYHADLSRHPLFKGLASGEFEILRRYYEIVRIPGRSDFIYPGDAMDSLYIVLKGQAFSGKKRYYSGDFWGLEHLLKPESCVDRFSSKDDLVVFRLKSENFRRMLKSHPGLSRHFRPRRDDEDMLVEGLPKDNWKSVKRFTSLQERKGTLIHYKSRTSKKSFSFSLLVPAGILLAGIILSDLNRWFLLLVLLGLVILGGECFFRNLTLYKVSDRAVIKRFFNFRTFRQDQEIIPIDQIQTVTISTKGLVSKLLRIGDLYVQTAGKGIQFLRIDSPARLQVRLMELKKRAVTEEHGRERDTLRELVGRRFTPETANEVLYSGDLSSPEQETLSNKQIFRKSPFILIGQLFPSLALTVAFISVSCILTEELASYWVIALIGGGLAGVVRAAWLAVDWWNDIYMINFPHIWDIERKPLGKEDIRKQTELGLILNVTASQKGLFSLIFNYGNVLIETAGRGEPLIFYSVRSPFFVQNELLRYRDYSLRIQETRRRIQARDDLLEFTEILDQARSREDTGSRI